VKYFEYSDRVFVLSDFIDSLRCQSLVSRAETLGFSDAPISTSGGEAYVPAARNNSRVILDDSELASDLWEILAPHVPERIDSWCAVGLNERFRFYRYDKYQSFSRHSDGRFARNEQEESRLTFMVYLNSGYDGGFTDFDEFKVWPSEGMALCFPHELSHEGAVVTHGTKYVLRSDVMYRTDR